MCLTTRDEVAELRGSTINTSTLRDPSVHGGGAFEGPRRSTDALAHAPHILEALAGTASFRGNMLRDEWVRSPPVSQLLLSLSPAPLSRHSAHCIALAAQHSWRRTQCVATLSVGVHNTVPAQLCSLQPPRVHAGSGNSPVWSDVGVVHVAISHSAQAHCEAALLATRACQPAPVPQAKVRAPAELCAVR